MGVRLSVAEVLLGLLLFVLISEMSLKVYQVVLVHDKKERLKIMTAIEVQNQSQLARVELR